MRSKAFFWDPDWPSNNKQTAKPHPRRIVDTQLSRVKWPEALRVWNSSGTGDLHLAAMPFRLANCARVETGCRSNWVCLRPPQKTANRLYSLIYYRIVLLKKSGGFPCTAGDATVQCLEVHLANDCTISGLQSAEKLQKTWLGPPRSTKSVHDPLRNLHQFIRFMTPSLRISENHHLSNSIMVYGSIWARRYLTDHN